MLRMQDLQPWKCSCGFRNTGANKVCGGSGALGCNQPRHQANQPPTVVYNMNGGSNSWLCPCGFKNVAKNKKCGGNGNLGCKAGRPLGGSSGGHTRSQFQSYAPNQTLGGGRWRCADCGFNNSDTNDMCGGNGRLGCNRPRVDSSIASLPGVVSIPKNNTSISLSDLFPPLETTPAKKKEKEELNPWICSCGFKNKAQNSQCGGRGPLGCNAARPEMWSCICGFRNRGDNEKCGGTGPMGCDRFKPSPQDSLPQVIYSPSAFGPYTGGISSIYSSPVVPKSKSERSNGKWVCVECGFKNSPQNLVCGGSGNLGCKASRDVDVVYHKNFRTQIPGAVSFASAAPPVVVDDGGHGGAWECGVCRFQNRPSNSVCGGQGTLGCKADKPNVVYLAVYQDQLIPRSENWLCKCGFQNREGNEFCGGKGRLGCGSAGPSGWRCSTCGFQNRQDNVQCGGRGKLGCNAPLPLKGRKRRHDGDDMHSSKRQKLKIVEESVSPRGGHTETIDLT